MRDGIYNSVKFILSSTNQNTHTHTQKEVYCTMTSQVASMLAELLFLFILSKVKAGHTPTCTLPLGHMYFPLEKHFKFPS